MILTAVYQYVLFGFSVVVETSSFAGMDIVRVIIQNSNRSTAGDI